MVETDMPCTELVVLGERELAAFVRSITELFGADQARMATEDWFEAIALLDCHTSRPSHSWRFVSIAALTHFLDRAAQQRLLKAAPDFSAVTTSHAHRHTKVLLDTIVQ